MPSETPPVGTFLIDPPRKAENNVTLPIDGWILPKGWRFVLGLAAVAACTIGRRATVGCQFAASTRAWTVGERPGRYLFARPFVPRVAFRA